MVCFYCSEQAELRPYGPGGAMVCFLCAMATPERVVQTGAAFGALLDAAETLSPLDAVVVGQESGPQPYEPGSLD